MHHFLFSDVIPSLALDNASALERRIENSQFQFQLQFFLQINVLEEVYG